MNLAEAYPIEQKRLLDLIDTYREIGPAGAFGAITIRAVLERANAAAAAHDTVAMLRSYNEMKECQ